MNTTPSSAQHVTSTTAPDPTRTDHDQPTVDATQRIPAAGARALVLGDVRLRGVRRARHRVLRQHPPELAPARHRPGDDCHGAAVGESRRSLAGQSGRGRCRGLQPARLRGRRSRDTALPCRLTSGHVPTRAATRAQLTTGTDLVARGDRFPCSHEQRAVDGQVLATAAAGPSPWIPGGVTTERPPAAGANL